MSTYCPLLQNVTVYHQYLSDKLDRIQQNASRLTLSKDSTNIRYDQRMSNLGCTTFQAFQGA